MMKTRFLRRSQKEELGRRTDGNLLTSSEQTAMLTDEGTAGLIAFDNVNGSTGTNVVDYSSTSSERTIERIMQQQASGNAVTTRASAAAAASSTPLVPAVTATISNPLTIPQSSAKSPARAIPRAAAHQQQRHRESEDSTASFFLSGILNSPSHGSNQLSHTPPNVLGTSYENRHFGKRQRSGSISGRLRSASDLEDKGLIDRQQKAILKDLIICGDEELQDALDQYEAGNAAVLQEMIQSGALQNKAMPDLDLLGDLDLDFLTVNDIGDDLADDREGPGMYSLQHHIALPQHIRNQTSSASDKLPNTSSAPKRCSSDATHYRGKNAGMVSPEYDDGIGELEFMGDMDGDDSGYYESTQVEADGEAEIDLTHQSNQQLTSQQPSKQRSFSPPPIGNDTRPRSNSLFSALINDPKLSTTEGQSELGRWMDRVPVTDQNILTATLVTTDDGSLHHKTTASKTTTKTISQPIPIPDAESDNIAPQPTKRKPGRRKSDSAVMDRKEKARLKQELADKKRQEKQEKREKREREKQEKKEARLAAKEEKKKIKDKKKEVSVVVAMEEDEKPVHVPGSGRPRSMSDPNLRTKRDEFGLVEIDRPDGWVGAYSPESRKVRIEKFLVKRNNRVWTKTVKYDVRKNFADSRLRVKGRFVKKEDEMLMRDLMSLT